MCSRCRRAISRRASPRRQPRKLRRAAELLSQARCSWDHGLHPCRCIQADTLLREARPELYLAGADVGPEPLAIQARAYQCRADRELPGAKWDNGRQHSAGAVHRGGAEALRMSYCGTYPHGVITGKIPSYWRTPLGLARPGWRSLSKNSRPTSSPWIRLWRLQGGALVRVRR
jgi:hypothetical protein